MKFTQGDIFYTGDGAQFQLYKVLRSDDEFGAYHVLCYAPVKELPKVEEVGALAVAIYHAPIAQEGFPGAVLLGHSSVADEELVGYWEYMRQMGDYTEIAAKANEYYLAAYQLTDERRYEEAIEQYTKAIELVPVFFEAIDNRAFCKMDLGRWEDAIVDFELSLTVQPGSALAEFSIGECYYRMGDFERAKAPFERALAIDPSLDLGYFKNAFTK